jgi:hypothetical protein
VYGQHHAPAVLPAVPIVCQAGWAPALVWTGAENLAVTEIRSPDRPARRDYAIPAHQCESGDKQNHSLLRPVADCLAVTLSRLFAYYLGLDTCSLQKLSAPKCVRALQLLHCEKTIDFRLLFREIFTVLKKYVITNNMCRSVQCVICYCCT